MLIDYRKHRLRETLLGSIVLLLLCASSRCEPSWRKAAPHTRHHRFGNLPGHHGGSNGAWNGGSDHSAALKVVREISADHPLGNQDLFSNINRRRLASCSDLYPYAAIAVDTTGQLADVQTVTVTVTGVIKPTNQDWVAVFSPTDANLDACPATSAAMYLQTGDTSSLPLTCHYPVKYKFLSTDPEYISCGKTNCEVTVGSNCLVQSCSGSVSFRLINIRTDVFFVFFTGGLALPCVINTSSTLSFANPKSPLYGHLSSVDSTGTQMRVTWVSGDGSPQQVKYNGMTATSSVSTFTAASMSSPALNPANDFGWHDPGFIHSAVMIGLTPSTSYSYSYGRDNVGWSKITEFTTPPAVGANSVRVVIYGDMGKAERENSSIHFSTPGSISVVDALSKRNDFDMVFHIGDISYATGFLVEWDSFLELLTPVASKVSYMTAIGNHERDFPGSGSIYTSTDSGGEIGIPYETYFPMPTSAADKPWYSYSSGPIHFTVMSTEHNWTRGSEQYSWLQEDLASVNRTTTPWIVFAGHRPMYSSYTSTLNFLLPPVDTNFAPELEPLLLSAEVDIAVWGHVHNYERSCAIYNSTCLGMPTDDAAGIATYNNADYKAPVQVVVGTGGFESSDFGTATPPTWSLARIRDYGYIYIQANRTRLTVQFVSSTSGTVGDQCSFTR